MIVSAACLAADESVLRDREETHLRTALECLNMTTADMGFAKDHGEPRLVLERVRRLLREPLELPRLADRILKRTSKSDPGAAWRLAEWLLEVNRGRDDETETAGPIGAEAEQDLAQALAAFVREADLADDLLKEAFEGLTPAERAYIAASTLGDLFNADDREAAREALAAIGIPVELIDETIRESLALDPEPAATRCLDAVEKVDLAALIAAGRVLQQAAFALKQAASGIEDWPKKVTRIPAGKWEVLVGTGGDDVYDEPAVLVLDPGGSDVYRGVVGSANGLQDRALSVIVDLGGDDRHANDGLLGAGAGLFGVSVLVDVGGNDKYEAKYTGQAAALCGAAWLEDMEGTDTYRAYAFAQGAGQVGVGVLRDLAGNDVYEVGLYGQAFAGLRGVGLLVDREGADRYLAGGREPDHERHGDRFVSLSQGFAIGLRPFGGGGVAALVDSAGNDTYQADVFGQGVSYWYSAGLLLDLGGNDTYTVHHYGQGSGIHLSSGLLYDREGHDVYTGYILAQGNAHDYAVGMLFDQGGDDTYTADHHAQGRALNNGLALLIDSGGSDAYFGRQPDQCQGAGNDGGHRECGSLALLLDLAGKDSYSCGAEDGARLLRPWYGIVYDVKGE
ncbi:MAG: hypothetical protein JXB04_08630 [Kiritimatiellae bacterium]|nr:hypothetical protein [Kiritimatiellia bacterium]